MFLFHGTIFPSGSLALISSIVWQKTTWKTKVAKSFDIYGCNIQNLKVGTVPTAYPADSRKAFCEVCNDAIMPKYCELNRHN